MTLEIFEAICEYYDDDKDTKYECLSHLYKTTNDSKLRKYIDDYFFASGRCPVCCSLIYEDDCEYCTETKLIKIKKGGIR